MDLNKNRFALLIIILATIVLGTSLFLAPNRAQAHADYERSDPAADSVMASAPDSVHIWFTQELFRREGENWIEVFGPDGAEVHIGDAVIDDDDRAHLWVELQPGLGDGEYLVRWRSLSAQDGDTEEGEFTFLVDPSAPEATQPPATPTTAPSATPETAPTESPAPTEESQPSSGIPCLGSALFGLGALALVWRRRK